MILKNEKNHRIDLKFKNCYGNKNCQEEIFKTVEKFKTKVINKKIDNY